ncbi:MAG: outer membrane protein assembly factor BamD [Candidatus Mycalebacterium zealandia]|nr:MAG: outer membrane protein assembly factor BamD [Candidatus Mycalebacterium zealandia]
MLQKRTFFTLAAAALILCSCGGGADYSAMTAEQMFTRSSEIADKGASSYEHALDILQELQIRHGFSSYAPLASLKTADIYFADEKFQSAADQYKRFIADNPKHPGREHALLGLSESFYRMKESYTRDQEPCKQAIYWYQSLLSYHPETEHKDSALEKIGFCNETLAESELEIGKFYLRRKHYEAARRRFTYVAKNFPQTESAAQSTGLLASLPPEEKDSDENTRDVR